MPIIPPPVAGTLPIIGRGYGMAWTPELRATPAYTATPVPGPFVGGLLDLLSAARLADLNTLRAAVENNRVFAEETRKQLNALVADMTAAGLISPT